MNRDRQIAASRQAIAAGIPFDRDFHALSTAHVDSLCTIARAVGYRKPRNANGSLARCFYAYLNRGV